MPYPCLRDLGQWLCVPPFRMVCLFQDTFIIAVLLKKLDRVRDLGDQGFSEGQGGGSTPEYGLSSPQVLAVLAEIAPLLGAGVLDTSSDSDVLSYRVQIFRPEATCHLTIHSSKPHGGYCSSGTG